MGSARTDTRWHGGVDQNPHLTRGGSDSAAAARDIDRVGGARDHRRTLVHEAGVRSGHEGEEAAVNDTQVTRSVFGLGTRALRRLRLHGEEAAAREVESRHCSYQERCVCYESASTWVEV